MSANAWSDNTRALIEALPNCRQTPTESAPARTSAMSLAQAVRWVAARWPDLKDSEIARLLGCQQMSVRQARTTSRATAQASERPARLPAAVRDGAPLEVVIAWSHAAPLSVVLRHPIFADFARKMLAHGLPAGAVLEAVLAHVCAADHDTLCAVVAAHKKSE